MTNPTPTQPETLERFVLDKSDCVDGGDGCKAEMRHSVAGAFVYHSEIERACAAVAGPRGNAETLVKKWIATLQDESRVTDEDAEDLTLRIIAFAATSSPAPAANEAATRLREFFNEDYTLIARHFKDTTKDRDITGDVEDLLNAVAPADNDTESLLSKITTIADIGSAEEFGDALERLRSIRVLIDTTPTTKGDR